MLHLQLCHADLMAVTAQSANAKHDEVVVVVQRLYPAHDVNVNKEEPWSHALDPLILAIGSQ